MKKIPIICLFLALITLLSCSARIDGSLSADGSAAVAVNMSLGARVTVLIRSIAAASGQPGAAGSPILDSAAINQALSSSPGAAQSALRNTSPSAIEGTVRVSKVNDFLSLTGGRGFISFEQTGSGGRCAVNISLDNSAEIISMFSSDIDDYLNALMAPIVTGDAITKDEYLDTIELFYGKPIRDELAASRVRASIEFPGNITGVRGGTYSGRRAEFDIPLADLLALENPLNLEVSWR